MKALFTPMLLAAIFASQIALLGMTQAGAGPMPCCREAADHATSSPSHCPPLGSPANSCCADCPYLLSAMLPAEITLCPQVNRSQIAVFPTDSQRAHSRMEEPPVPPPRES